jgi:hypothetical protein
MSTSTNPPTRTQFDLFTAYKQPAPRRGVSLLLPMIGLLILSLDPALIGFLGIAPRLTVYPFLSPAFLGLPRVLVCCWLGAWLLLESSALSFPDARIVSGLRLALKIAGVAIGAYILSSVDIFTFARTASGDDAGTVAAYRAVAPIVFDLMTAAFWCGLLISAWQVVRVIARAL